MLPHYIKCIPGEGELKLRKFMNNDIIDCNAEIDNLDNLPFPDFDIFNFDFYKTKKCLPLLSSRGCINRCAFCSEKNLYRKKYRQHSAEYIVDMIAYYKKKYNISWFVFQDSLINADLKRLKKICSMILEKNLEIKWEAQVYIRKDMNTDLLSLMKKSGCYNMFIGLESGSDKILSLMNKGYNSETAALFFRKCSDAEIFFETSLIFGFPGETEKTVEETFNFFKNNSKYIKKIAQINPYVYYPLSGISNIQQKNNLDLNTIINNFLKLCNDNNIRYTKSFINNLTGL
jgi:radical SAM superfamily enzyme YgiQ (UPF0313 family)